ncbi:MAG TPA: AgmX/PglI C-terminal domain-containing protein [Polyangia bacterium]
MLGILVGVVLCAGSGWLYLQKGKDCLSRCGDGTHCFGGRCIANAPPTTVATAPTPKRRKRHGGGGGVGPAQPELKLEPGDDRSATSGESLGRAEHIDLSQGGDDGKELQQEDLDAVFRGAQSAISRCITDAVGDYPLESGKIEVAFRVERTGQVRKVRITAPQLLMRRGFSACVRPIVTGLHFPSSGGANVVTYPFALQ